MVAPHADETTVALTPEAAVTSSPNVYEQVHPVQKQTELVPVPQFKSFAVLSGIGATPPTVAVWKWSKVLRNERSNIVTHPLLMSCPRDVTEVQINLESVFVLTLITTSILPSNHSCVRTEPSCSMYKSGCGVGQQASLRNLLAVMSSIVPMV